MEVDYGAVVAAAKFYEGGLGSPVQKAARLTTAKFAKGFPGWQIHWTICSGEATYYRSIEAYFLGLAKRLARARKKNGFAYISEAARADRWIKQAARDAMEYVITGRFSEGINERAAQLGVANKTYQKLRDPIALGMRLGMDRWAGEFNYQLSQFFFDLLIPGEENPC